MQHRCLRKYIFQKIVLFIFLANLQSPVNGGGRTVGRTVTKWNQPMRVHQRYRAFLTISMHMFGLAAAVLAPSVAGPLLSCLLDSYCQKSPCQAVQLLPFGRAVSHCIRLLH